MEGKLYCEVRSSLLMLLMLFGSGLFCFVFEKKKKTLLQGKGGRETYSVSDLLRTLTLCPRVPRPPQEKGECTRK